MKSLRNFIRKKVELAEPTFLTEAKANQKMKQEAEKRIYEIRMVLKVDLDHQEMLLDSLQELRKAFATSESAVNEKSQDSFITGELRKKYVN